MIKIIDVIGSSIILSCCFFFVPISLLAFYAIPVFFLGVAVSTCALASHVSQKLVTVYVLSAIGFFCLIFVFLAIHGNLESAMILATPGLTASLSLIMAHYTKNKIPKTSTIRRTPL